MVDKKNQALYRPGEPERKAKTFNNKFKDRFGSLNESKAIGVIMHLRTLSLRSNCIQIVSWRQYLIAIPLIIL